MQALRRIPFGALRSQTGLSCVPASGSAVTAAASSTSRRLFQSSTCGAHCPCKSKADPNLNHKRLNGSKTLNRATNAVGSTSVGTALLNSTGLLKSNGLTPFGTSSSSITQIRTHTHKANPNAQFVPLTFVQSDGRRHQVQAEVGMSLLEVAHANEIPVEGACEGSLACSTCHVIISKKLFKSLDEPCEDEEDMLDLAPDLCDTSRLGCQLIVDASYTNEEVLLPSHTLNFYVDGHQPMGH